MTRSTLFGALAALLLVGCSQPGQPASTVTPAPSPTATATGVLAKEYTEMVGPANNSLDQVASALNAPGANMTTTKAAFNDLLTALVALNTKLVSFQARMPAAAQPDVQQLRQGVGQEISDVQAILGATSAAEWQSAVIRWSADVKGFGAAAQLVRADLGLPPATLVTPAPTP